MKKKALMFDLDGTIADTIYSIRDGVNLAMKKNGLPERSYDEIRVSIGNGAKELIRLSLPKKKQNNDGYVEAVLTDYNVLYSETYANIDGCYDGMSEVLHELHNRGYRLAVLSNKQDEYVKKIVDMLFPDKIIDFVQGQTHLPKKPDPTVPLMIAKSFGVNPCECAFIGDSEVDVKTAKNAGMMSVACPWGYRPKDALTGADVILRDPLHLLEIFE